MPEVSVIIVNYNTGDIIKDCIASLLQQQNISLDIIVVDNNSDDDSVEKLKAYDKEITLIVNNKNTGFGRANNLAFKQARGEYIFLLNPDAKLQTSMDLYKLHDFLSHHPEIGLVGPCIMKNNKVYKPMQHYPGEKHLKSVFTKLPGNIAWVVGACMLLRRETYAKIHGFDEDFFLYGEEADLALRIRQQGLEIAYLPDVVVEHIGGASERRTRLKEIWQKKQNGKHVFYKKHYQPSQIMTMLIHDIKKAKRKLLLIRLKKLIGMMSRHDYDKFIRYQTVIESSTALLNALALKGNLND